MRAQKHAAAAQQAAGNSMQRETDLRAEVRDLAERARKAEVSAAEREAYAQSLRYGSPHGALPSPSSLWVFWLSFAPILKWYLSWLHLRPSLVVQRAPNVV